MIGKIISKILAVSVKKVDALEQQMVVKNVVKVESVKKKRMRLDNEMAKVAKLMRTSVMRLSK